MTQRSAVLADERGMTLIEVVIAVFLSALIFGALASAMVSNNRSALGSQRQTQLLSVLQQRIEYVHQTLTQNYAATGFAALALSSNPAQGLDSPLPAAPADPNDYITPYVAGFVTATSGTAENYLVEKNWDVSAEGTIDGGTTYKEELDVDPTNGKVTPVVYVDLTTDTTYTSASNVPAGDPYATVYTYITLPTVGLNAALSACPSTLGTGSATADARRVIVAAVMHTSTGLSDVGPNGPQYASTLLTAPIPTNQCQGATGLRIGLNIP
jgi:type II secretory pathway pseudopilin PulG